ncbi:MAG: hypothetical protein HQL52_10255 [Magnetococcales bacterium]|nr:hypothetical protein [Magnetococcales bacterium]
MRRVYLRRLLLLMLLLAGPVGLATAGGFELGDRVQIGVRMFPKMVGGNLQISTKKNPSGKLLLLVAYDKDWKTGQKVAEHLKSSVDNIHNLPLEVAVTGDLDFKPYEADHIAGIFLADKLSKGKLDRLIDFGIKRQIVLFSPFEGDVARGVTTGLYVATRVRPALNLTTLVNSKIRYNRLFLKVAKSYE